MVYKTLTAVICGLMLVAVVEVLLRPGVEAAPNTAVNERTYELLKEGMADPEIQRVLGLPHKTLGGAIVRMESPGSSDFKHVIQERRRAAGADWMNVYQGNDEESIRVLFSADTGRAIGIEYRVADLPVLYKGQKSILSAKQFIASVDRAIDPAVEKRRKVLQRHQRVEQLRKDKDSTSEQTVDNSPAPPVPAGDAPPLPLPRISQATTKPRAQAQ